MDSEIILAHLKNLDAVYTVEPNKGDGYLRLFGDGSGDYCYNVYNDNFQYEFDYSHDVFDFNSPEEFCDKAKELTRAIPI